MAVNVDVNQVLTIGLANLPTLVMLGIGLLYNNSRLTDLRAHMDGRFSDISSRFNELSSGINSRFGDVNSRLDRIERRLDAIEADLKVFYQDITRLKERVGIE